MDARRTSHAANTAGSNGTGTSSTVTIDRPEVMNSFHPMANIELAEVFDEFCADDDQWVAIITGAGERAFSAGNDLKYLAAGGDELGLRHPRALRASRGATTTSSL